MATWSQAHDNPGTAGNLVMTRISPETIRRGDIATLQLRSCGEPWQCRCPERPVEVLPLDERDDPDKDHEIASLTWNTFSSWWSGSLNVRVPNTVPTGQYFLGWIVTTDTAERSSSNNTAILMRDHNAAFAKVRITVN